MPKRNAPDGGNSKEARRAHRDLNAWADQLDAMLDDSAAGPAALDTLNKWPEEMREIASQVVDLDDLRSSAERENEGYRAEAEATESDHEVLIVASEAALDALRKVKGALFPNGGTPAAMNDAIYALEDALR